MHTIVPQPLAAQWVYYGWGSRGLEFESQHSDQKFRKLT
nr:MAG TPA: hypothetical protein [Caudoviricetes sp.]